MRHLKECPILWFWSWKSTLSSFCTTSSMYKGLESKYLRLKGMTSFQQIKRNPIKRRRNNPKECKIRSFWTDWRPLNGHLILNTLGKLANAWAENMYYLVIIENYFQKATKHTVRGSLCGMWWGLKFTWLFTTEIGRCEKCS